VKKWLLFLLIFFTGGCIGHILREYHRFQADRPLYESVGVNWETAWHDRLLLDVEWYVGIMAILVIAWIIVSVMGKNGRGQRIQGV